MSDYERIAKIIRHLDENHAEQPNLAELAGLLKLSPFHFHRVFTEWAGVTPKDFLQCLTVAHAKAMLKEGRNILDTALSAGLSGPGRLHDLCVQLEAASPGELKTGGAGLQIQFGIASTPFGQWLAAECDRGICHIGFIEGGDDERELDNLRRAWPNASFARNDDWARSLSARIFAPSPGASNIRAFVRGTAFQVRVWRALLEIPSGSLISYGRLAAAVNQDGAARAVGTAVGCNTLAVLIPCHRVIRETGVISSYRWGATRKRALLAWESAARQHPDRPQARR